MRRMEFLVAILKLYNGYLEDLFNSENLSTLKKLVLFEIFQKKTALDNELLALIQNFSYVPMQARLILV